MSLLISKCGKVIENGVIRKQYLCPKGYLKVHVTLRGKKGPQFVHRLLAYAYIPNPENHTSIDHINEIKTDNRLENLRWLDRGENKRRSSKLTGTVYKDETKYEFDCQKVFAREHKVNVGNFNSMLNGHRKSAGGFTL